MGYVVVAVGSNSNGSKASSTLLNDPKAMEALQTILMAHVVSPDPNALRADAWQTMGSMIVSSCRHHGKNKVSNAWTTKWMMMTMKNGSSASSSSKNNPKQKQQQQAATPPPPLLPIICTWARLASGEWKIQLEHMAASSASAAAAGGDAAATVNSLTNSTSNNRNNNDNDNNMAILDGCAKTIMSVVDFLLTLEDRPDQAAAAPSLLLLNATALLHIKESLDEAFAVTTEYIATVDNGDDDHDDNGDDSQGHGEESDSARSSTKAVVRELWCQLLPELEMEAIQGLESTLAAFRKLLLQSSSSAAADDVMMRPLVHVLSAMEDGDATTCTRLRTMLH
ncbi:MAG: hypothetical protein SGARI_004174 [Bacillariaceae sp.]